MKAYGEIEQFAFLQVTNFFMIHTPVYMYVRCMFENTKHQSEAKSQLAGMQFFKETRKPERKIPTCRDAFFYGKNLKHKSQLAGMLVIWKKQWHKI